MSGQEAMRRSHSMDIFGYTIKYGVQGMQWGNHREAVATINTAQRELDRVNSELQREKDPAKLEGLLNQVRGARAAVDEARARYTSATAKTPKEKKPKK